MQPLKNGPTATPSPPETSPAEAGFSIIEGLIAALLLLIVTLGILPLFSRAMSNNVKGNDSTRQSNAAMGAFETSIALPFNAGDTTVAPATTSTVVLETMALKKIDTPTGGADQALSNRWELPADLAAGDLRVLDRQRTLRQFSFDDFSDNQVFDNPLPGDTQPRLVHLKVLDLVLQDATGPESQAFALRLIQAY